MTIAYDMIDTKRTGQNIKQLFKEKGLTPNDISRRGIATEQAVYKWFRGESVPTVDNLLILKVLLGLDTIDQIIVTEENNKEGG